MKKIFLIIIMFFFCIVNVYADDNLVIETLSIKNGNISPKYDKYNNYYSVTISNEITNLEFELGYDDTIYDIEILNNENLKQNKLVYLTIFNKNTDERNTYIFKTYIEDINDSVVNINDNEISSLEIEDSKEKPKQIAPIVGGICFVLIFFVYYVLFLK